MTMRVAANVLNSACDGATDPVDVGAGPNGSLEFYSGAPPATIDGAPAGDLLATVDFQNPAFGTPTGGVAPLLGTPIATTGTDNGTIGFVRVLDADSAVVWDDDDVGTSGNNITVNTTTISSGVDVELTSYNFSAASASP